MEDKTLGKDFHTKRAWGMAPEEVPAEDFGQIMVNEAKQKEEVRLAKLADEELARRLQLEMNEEAMIQKAIAESLKDVDHNPSREMNLSSKLNVNCEEFVFQKPQSKKKGGKGAAHQQ